LEEAGLHYRAKAIDSTVRASGDYRMQQPFGQIPIFEEDGLTLFESGAIVLHIGARSEALLPTEKAARARATTWVFAALNTVEVPIQGLIAVDAFFAGEEWAKLRRPGAVQAVQKRLRELSAWLGERDYLEERFTAGDLMMTTVLRFLRHTDLVAAQPNLKAYQARCEARPAFQRALKDQMAAYGNG
jgi:glutathione S-transferase